MPIRQTRPRGTFWPIREYFFTSFETIESRGQRFKLNAREAVEGMRELVADKPALIPARLKNLHACPKTLPCSRMRTSLQSNEYYIDWSTLHHPGQKPVQFNACEPQRSTSSYVASRILRQVMAAISQVCQRDNSQRREDMKMQMSPLIAWNCGHFCDLLFWAGCDLTIWNSDNVVLCYKTLKHSF